MIELTASEFCGFNLKGRLKLLSKDARYVGGREFTQELRTELYKVYSFFVEVTYDTKLNKFVKAEPTRSHGWAEFYQFDQLDLN